MTRTCSDEMRWMKRLCLVSRESLRTTRKTLAGRAFLNLEAFAPSTEWEFISKDAREGVDGGRVE